MSKHREVIEMLIKTFGEDVPIGKIAQYAEDEFLIPKHEAVQMIYDAT